MTAPWKQDALAANGRPVRENFGHWFGQSLALDASLIPLVLYHGTRQGNFDAFKPHIRRGEQLGFGIHFAERLDFATRYAKDNTVARKGKAPHVHSVFLSAQVPLLASAIVAEGTPAFVLAQKLAGHRLCTVRDEAGRRTAWMQNAIDSTSPARAERLIRKAGFDAVVYEARIGVLGAPGANARVLDKCRSWIVFEPCQVKSAADNAGLFLAGSASLSDRDADLALRSALRAKSCIARFEKFSRHEPGNPNSTECFLVTALNAMSAMNFITSQAPRKAAPHA